MLNAPREPKSPKHRLYLACCVYLPSTTQCFNCFCHSAVKLHHLHQLCARGQSPAERRCTTLHQPLSRSCIIHSLLTALLLRFQACILAVGGGQQKIVLVDGKPQAKNIMTVTISADHRVYDGEMAAKFLNAFCKYMNSPLQLVM